MTRIEPVNGRIVRFHPGPDIDVIQNDQTQPLAAIVTHVHMDGTINITVFPSFGDTGSLTSLTLRQPGDIAPSDGKGYCDWMPYQVGQAKKTDELAKDLTAASGNAAGGQQPARE